MVDAPGGWKPDAIAAAKHWLTLVKTPPGQQSRWKSHRACHTGARRTRLVDN